MKETKGVGLENVQAVYDGPEGVLWELIMGEQIHIGGFSSSMDLSERAGIGEGMSGVDLCCCNGAGMRFLVRFRNVAKMMGVDVPDLMTQSVHLNVLPTSMPYFSMNFSPGYHELRSWSRCSFLSTARAHS